MIDNTIDDRINDICYFIHSLSMLIIDNMMMHVCFIYVHETITMVTTVCVFDVVNGCEWGMLIIQCYG